MDVDVLVIGGGPAGLLFASYLGERYRVLLIERGALGNTSKYWVSTPRRLALHDLDHCVRYQASGLLVSPFLRGVVEAAGDVVLVDEDALLATLVSHSRSRDVILRE